MGIYQAKFVIGCGYAFLTIYGQPYVVKAESLDGLTLNVTLTPIPEKFTLICGLAEICDIRIQYCLEVFEVCKSCELECHPLVLQSKSHDDADAEETRCNKICPDYYFYRGKRSDLYPKDPQQEEFPATCPEAKLFIPLLTSLSLALMGCVGVIIYLLTRRQPTYPIQNTEEPQPETQDLTEKTTVTENGV